MFSLKKAQSGVEYLQTYGWAMLVIAVVGIALWQLGIFGPHGGINTASGFEKIKILDSSIKYKKDAEANALNFSVVNTLGTRIKLKVSNISGDCRRAWFNHQDLSGIPGFATQAQCESHWDCYWVGGGLCRCQDQTTLDPGDTEQIKHSICDPLIKGENFEVYLSFSYSIKLGNEEIWFKDDGYLRGYVE